ncbi:hypothetical protein [Burkholderia ubonensis]|uniref:hypothetical protein n=1 Tax=Burkholderia ubonensis TaxID=101571 RepID=UPI000AAFA599|nr:hypothetical protein [Burkholderia ubonensis]
MTVRELKARANEMIQRELDRCRKKLGPEAWEVHREWVTANVVEAAKQYLAREAAEGRL